MSYSLTVKVRRIINAIFPQGKALFAQVRIMGKGWVSRKVWHFFSIKNNLVSLENTVPCNVPLEMMHKKAGQMVKDKSVDLTALTTYHEFYSFVDDV